MTEQITVPSATWDAMREALDALTFTIEYEFLLHDDQRKAWELGAQALTAANAVSRPKATEPAGWKRVPIRPTVEMLDAANASDREYSLRAFGAGVHMCQSGEDHWAAMLAAAPEAKQ